jgi:hypothetical protein
MAVTASPTSVLQRVKDFQAQFPTAVLTHLAVVSTAPGSVATPGITGGFFDVWYEAATNKLILDYTSTAL